MSGKNENIEILVPFHAERFASIIRSKPKLINFAKKVAGLVIRISDELMDHGNRPLSYQFFVC